ncbi:PhzF family phenazine biosynthesis protein [Micromonospora sp. M71_S20]|uniref:PhzF family phenazine biosynthesis protein n=1 Tax=Micromonospora sp. M71_S20 TaxID=592872 RepID=UPI000EAED2B9|nr:PhzF family phenazine biosynthesis protein [Micromonospora sp. M71_S20]RLK24645.1 PhzF family phenazine biosynthesis protein [Micromonospora sp. M71_S20]
MEIPLYQVDAFTDRVFFGNPAAVCPLDEWLSDEVMQAIGLENNLAETAFIIDRGDSFALRWFTPSMEVDLCGHATLAAAHVVLNHLRPEWDEVTFHSNTGPLIVSRTPEGQFMMSFPALPRERVDPPEALLAGLSIAPTAVYGGMDYMAVYDNEEDLRAIEPDQRMLGTLDRRAVVVTAPGISSDFVARFFGPKQSIPEDQFTGSAHCMLVPYWAEVLGRTSLTSRQFSPRLGKTLTIHANCELRDDRVILGGSTRQYLAGVITLDDDEVARLSR